MSEASRIDSAASLLLVAMRLGTKFNVLQNIQLKTVFTAAQLAGVHIASPANPNGVDPQLCLQLIIDMLSQANDLDSAAAKVRCLQFISVVLLGEACTQANMSTEEYNEHEQAFWATYVGVVQELTACAGDVVAWALKLQEQCTQLGII
jgi:hypothetical protein